ncbi:MAG TPA: endonuclease/exonuclease/phosphatase family protein [Caulobacteraceae bacterium]|jgi:endonuclease/exonuclease/phosphatase (EEP) superfamily protein YafD
MRFLAAFVRASLELALLLAATLSLLSLLGFWKNRFDLLTHFAPVWLALCLAGLVLIPVLRLQPRRLVLAVALAGVAASAGLMTPELVAAARPSARAQANEQRIRVVSFNLWIRNPEPERTAAWLLGSGADVLVLPEPERAAAGIIARLRAGYPYGIDCQGDHDCNAAILSRWPVSASGASPPYAWAVVQAPSGPFTVIGAHFTWPTNGWEQARQRRRVAELIARFDRRTTIVAGDFNTAPWSYVMRRQDRLFGLERRTRALSSWPAQPVSRHPITPPFPILPIDHLYAGGNWRTVDIRRGPRLGSDHFPVVADMARPANR